MPVSFAICPSGPGVLCAACQSALVAQGRCWVLYGCLCRYRGLLSSPAKCRELKKIHNKNEHVVDNNKKNTSCKCFELAKEEYLSFGQTGKKIQKVIY